MLVEQMGKVINMAALQLKAHQCRETLDLVEGMEAIRLMANVAPYHIPEEVAGQAPLTGVDQHKALLQLLPCRARHMHMGHVDMLRQPGHGADVLDARGQAAHLVLPAAAGGHHLLHDGNVGIQFFLITGDTQELKQRLDTGPGQDGRGAQPAALGHARHLGLHQESAAQPAQHLIQAAAFPGNDPAGQQGGLLQHKGVVGITHRLQFI